jgi:hypothetical protein
MNPGGTRTKEGSAAVSQNAVKHGIFSQEPVVKDVESPEEWERHRQGIISSLAPVGALEETLAERAALLLWRQARVARFEMYCIDRWQQEIPDDLKFRYQLEVGTTSPEARTNCSPEQIRAVHLQRQQFLTLLRRFPELADDAFLSYEEASRIGEAFLRQAGDQAELSIDGEPGEQPEDLPRVRVGTLREGLRRVAKQAGLHIAELWALTAQQAIADAAWQQERAERLEGYFPVYHAYRVVPREEELQKVMRYEAHLSRELARLLKDFHHLQKQRRAAAAEGERGKAKGEKETPPPATPTIAPLEGASESTDTAAVSPEDTEAAEASNGHAKGEGGKGKGERGAAQPSTLTVYPPDGGLNAQCFPSPGSPDAAVPDPNPSGIASSRDLGPGKGWADRGNPTAPSPRHGSSHSHRPRHKGRRM